MTVLQKTLTYSSNTACLCAPEEALSVGSLPLDCCVWATLHENLNFPTLASTSRKTSSTQRPRLSCGGALPCRCL